MTLTEVKAVCAQRIKDGEVKYGQSWLDADKDWPQELKEEVFDAINYSSRMGGVKGYILHKLFIAIALTL